MRVLNGLFAANAAAGEADEPQTVQDVRDRMNPKPIIPNRAGPA